MIYNLFISHSWTYSDSYNSLIKLLDNDPFFQYKNYSVPKDNPIHDAKNDVELYNAIKNQMQYASVVLVLAGVYSSYSRWIDKEIYIAKHEFMFPKNIIAIEPWGAERTSLNVKMNSDRIVRWNTSSIVNAIKELA